MKFGRGNGDGAGAPPPDYDDYDAYDDVVDGAYVREFLLGNYVTGGAAATRARTLLMAEFERAEAAGRAAGRHAARPLRLAALVLFVLALIVLVLR